MINGSAAAVNPIEPYRWVARYVGGGLLRQFDADRFHRAVEIDLARVESLELRGHPSGLLSVARRACIPDAAVVRARRRLRLPGGRVSLEIHAGFVYAGQFEGVIVNAHSGLVRSGVWSL